MNFEEKLAQIYDLIYRDKNYEKECDFIEKVFKKYSESSIRTILDIGCGAGGHAIPLVERGYNVLGIDVSEAMVKEAKEKSKNIANVDFRVMDMRNFQLDKKFDACIVMFAVMGYMVKNSDIIKALDNIHKHLKPNGIFLFEVWNGLAVMRTPPEQRIKEVENDKIKVVRIATPNLKSSDHTCEVNYKLFIINKKTKICDAINEKHIIRFYFPQEIKYYLENSGFEVLKICPFLELDGKLDENVWNMSITTKVK